MSQTQVIDLIFYNRWFFLYSFRILKAQREVLSEYITVIEQKVKQIEDTEEAINYIYRKRIVCVKVFLGWILMICSLVMVQYSSDILQQHKIQYDFFSILQILEVGHYIKIRQLGYLIMIISLMFFYSNNFEFSQMEQDEIQFIYKTNENLHQFNQQNLNQFQMELMRKNFLLGPRNSEGQGFYLTRLTMQIEILRPVQNNQEQQNIQLTTLSNDSLERSFL